jgi:hypothetical protein
MLPSIDGILDQCAGGSSGAGGGGWVVRWRPKSAVPAANQKAAREIIIRTSLVQSLLHLSHFYFIMFGFRPKGERDMEITQVSFLSTPGGRQLSC